MDLKTLAVLCVTLYVAGVAGVDADTLENGCPEFDSKFQLFHMPHDTYCNQYYKCQDGEKRLEYCPEGLEFNPHTWECMDPEEADCGCTTTPAPTTTQATTTQATTTQATTTQATTTTTPATTTTEPPCTCPGFPTGNEVLPDPNDCNIYLTCENGHIITHHCPEGQQWSVADQKCDWACHVGCTEVPLGCVGFEDGIEVLPNPDDCHSWLTCCDNTIVVNPCPEGQNYDYILQRCDWACHAQCYGHGTPTPPTGTPPIYPTECPFPDPLDYTVHLPHESSCHLFYKCDHGKPVLMHCPPHLHFNPLLQVCDWPYEAGCASEGGVISTTVRTSLKPGFKLPWLASNKLPNKQETRMKREVAGVKSRRCAKVDEFGELVRFAHHKDCSLFFECQGGKAELKCCPTDLHFSSELEKCVSKDEAQCAL